MVTIIHTMVTIIHTLHALRARSRRASLGLIMLARIVSTISTFLWGMYVPGEGECLECLVFRVLIV